MVNAGQYHTLSVWVPKKKPWDWKTRTGFLFGKGLFWVTFSEARRVVKLREGIRWHLKMGILGIWEGWIFFCHLLFCQGGLFQKQNIREWCISDTTTLLVMSKIHSQANKQNHFVVGILPPVSWGLEQPMSQFEAPYICGHFIGENPVMTHAEVAFQKATVPQVCVRIGHKLRCFFWGNVRETISKGGKVSTHQIHVTSWCSFLFSSLRDAGGDLATKISVPLWDHTLWDHCVPCVSLLSVLSKQFHSCGVLHRPQFLWRKVMENVRVPPPNATPSKERRPYYMRGY